MTTEDTYPCLIISLSDSTENNRFTITTPKLHLCRLATITHGACGIDLELMTVHRYKHACITRQGDNIILTNLGERNLRIYERALTTGQSTELHHGDVFLVPDPDTIDPEGEAPLVGLPLHYSILFLSDPERTARSTFYLNHQLRRVYVFGVDIGLASKEYDIVRYLYLHRPQPCARSDIITAVWPETRGEPALIALQEDSLHAHLNHIRTKIKAKTKGRFTFLEHVRGKGMRLLI